MSSTIQSPDSDTSTQGVRVCASARFSREDSDPDLGNWVYDYRIEISNDSERQVQLQTRHWIILDAEGRREDVRGAGVIGEFPVLSPGETYAYRSRCPLPTSWGTMEGSYGFVGSDGETFEVAIGRFFLVPPARPMNG